MKQNRKKNRAPFSAGLWTAGQGGGRLGAPGPQCLPRAPGFGSEDSAACGGPMGSSKSIRAGESCQEWGGEDGGEARAHETSRSVTDRAGLPGRGGGGRNESAVTPASARRRGQLCRGDPGQDVKLARTQERAAGGGGGDGHGGCRFPGKRGMRRPRAL